MATIETQPAIRCQSLYKDFGLEADQLAKTGTDVLGQAIFEASSESNLGKGLSLGLCVSFLALSVDHLVTRWARERRQLLGLD